MLSPIAVRAIDLKLRLILQDIDRPTIPNEPEEAAWKSDIAAELLRGSGIPFITLNPGASFRGLHDRADQHAGNAGLLLLSARAS